MAENTIRIEFEDDGGRGGGQQSAGRPPERSGVEPARPGADKPVSVELTKENADLIASYLRGKSTADEVFDKITSQPDPIQTPGTIPNPETAKAGDFVGPTYARADFVGPQLPDADPIAKLIKSAMFAAPGGGDTGLQAELFKQFKRQEDKESVEAARAAADADKLSRRESSEADRRVDETIDGIGRLIGLGGVAGTVRTALGMGGAAGGAGGGVGSLLGPALSGGGRAASMAGGSVAALGPLLAVLGAAKVVQDDIIGNLRTYAGNVRGAFEMAEGAARGLAGNEGLPVLLGAADRAASALDGLIPGGSIAATMLAEGIRTAAAGVEAFTSTVDAFISRGRELRGLDNNLATANAMADVARLQADIREAQVTGESLGRLTQAQTDLDQVGREIATILKSGVIDVLADIAEPVGQMAKMILPVVRTIGDVERTARRLPREIAGELFRDTVVKQVLEQVWAWWTGKEPKADELNELVQQVFEAARNAPIGPAGGGGETPEDRAGAPMWFAGP